MLAIAGAGHAEASIVLNYRAQGTFTTASPLSIGGVTATETSGGTLVVEGGDAGLGVLGGDTPFNDQIIDGSESVLFSFDAGPATGVGFTAITSGASASPDMNLEGFGGGGGSLGVVTFNPFTVPSPFGPDSYDVSARFGGVALSGFRIFGNGTVTGLSIATVTFTPEAVAIATPEPTTIALAASALPVGLIAWRRHRKAATA